MSGKKVYVGGGEYCYTDACSKHDRAESAELMRKATDAGAAGDVSGYMKLREEADAASKRERTAKMQNVHRSTLVTAQVLSPEERAARRKAAMKAIRSDLQSYQAKETDRNGDKIVKFHRDLGLPRYFRKPTGVAGLSYTRHAEEEALNDAYGNIPVLKKLNFDDADIIEVKYSQSTGKVTRMLARMKNGDVNVCLVLAPPAGPRQPWRVITNWYNEAGDTHHTLDASRYNTPSKASAPVS